MNAVFITAWCRKVFICTLKIRRDGENSDFGGKSLKWPICRKMAEIWSKMVEKIFFLIFSFFSTRERICPSLCCRNVPNSTIFRKLGNGFLSTSKVFWTLLWAFRHLRGTFQPFLSIFRAPETSRKLCRQPPRRIFEVFIGGKKVQNSFFRLLAKNEV